MEVPLIITMRFNQDPKVTSPLNVCSSFVNALKTILASHPASAISFTIRTDVLNMAS